MKYSKEIIVNLPLLRTVELIDNPDNLKEWQEGLVGREAQSGKLGTVGSTAKITYQMGKRTMEMIETTVTREPPHLFVVQYQSGKMWNEVRSMFSEVSKEGTKMRIETEFRCGGLMVLMLWLMPGAFKRQTLQYMQDFKRFAEGRGNAKTEAKE